MDEFRRQELARTSERMESATPSEILQWAMETYGPKLTMATAFGAEGCALIAMIAGIRDRTGLTLDIFNLDTGYQFPQTLALRERIQKQYGLEVRLVSNAETVPEMEARFGGPIYNRDSNECCRLRKVVPLNDAVRGFEAWITAIRRDQTPERAAQPIIGMDAKFDLVKINPLANWSKAQVWAYIRENNVPTNPLHDQGFPSIGCWPCTRPVKEGDDDRAGRWAGTDKRECGLHLSPAGQVTRVAS
ncbi:MAG: phosphoadenosine phosphosulfate reductase [Abditibacteriota bacterium]|jgi:phosphoadenosine phosphosulfate reductase|nr:phosphoadenosine phosphosulfate reductase [Abditibacteriota bacterium]